MAYDMRSPVRYDESDRIVLVLEVVLIRRLLSSGNV